MPKRLPWMFLIACLAASGAQAETVVTGDLRRAAQLGFAVQADSAATVRRLAAGSPAANAGLREGDRIVAVNGRSLPAARDIASALQRHKGDDRLTLAIERDGARRTIAFTPVPRPLERDDAIDVEYGAFTASDGARLRTIVTRPKGAAGPLPAVFFTQWVSCGSIETITPGRERQAGVIRRSGLAVIRVERAGTGDSEGPPCHALDYDTEVRHYREALDALARHPWVDPARILIWGESLGATTAPLVARGRRVAGLLVQGGGAWTYAERTIGFIRLRAQLDGSPRAALDGLMRASVEFTTDYLLRGRAPEAILKDKPALASAWRALVGDETGTQWGRPYAWHQQAARHDFLTAWAAIDAPVLVVHGEYDQFETADGHRLIVDTVNRLHPGNGEWLQIPMAGHDLERFATREAAASGSGGTAAHELFLQPVLAWLARVTGMKPSG